MKRSDARTFCTLMIERLPSELGDKIASTMLSVPGLVKFDVATKDSSPSREKRTWKAKFKAFLPIKQSLCICKSSGVAIVGGNWSKAKSEPKNRTMAGIRRTREFGPLPVTVFPVTAAMAPTNGESHRVAHEVLRAAPARLQTS